MADSLLKVDEICDDFETRWQVDRGLTIEKFQEFYPDVFQAATLGELIHQEIDLRFSAALEIDRAEYERRFPHLQSFIEEAFLRIEKLAEKQDFREEDFELWQPEFKEPTEGTVIGDFRVLDCIGQGGFGKVFRAINESDEVCYALKFPNEKTINSQKAFDRFKHEAALAKLLDHAAIAKSYGLSEVDGFTFIPQQLIKGKDLSEWRKVPRGQEEIVKLVVEIARGLAHAHRNGLVHRDIKPANVLIDETGQPKIVDFGLAVHENAQHRLRGERSGTPAYMSPEQVMGLSHRLDGRSDIWSLGVLLYELLVKTRPFRGSKMDELFEEIKFRDERPLDMRDNSIDEELQRICHKCLCKIIRQRYRTGDELARDLENWLRYKEVWKQQGFIPLVSKGLRAFGPEDSRGFRQLLPGSKDRLGVPECITFWKRQIEASEIASGERTFSVGVVFGPSGSGKSSLVRAGVLPNLDPNQVEYAILECSAENTENKLKASLCEACPSIPSRLGLVEILDGIKDGLWQTGKKKCVIVLDQFEQWLHANRDLDRSPLVEAIRHCDGKQLFCLLIVRDEFWIGTSKFLTAVGVDFHEGVNGQRVDLFDEKHACKVLYLIGRAMEKLPIGRDQMTREQVRFIEKVVGALSDDGQVISVHITMFAEMFKYREWTLAELKKVGGLSGVGERFLDETFNDKNSQSRFAYLKDEVRFLLETFLPDPRTDIREKQYSKSQLKSFAPASVKEAGIDQAIELLDKELRLISPTDAEGPGEGEATNGDIDGRYQLTHDYLVPSIRNWLNRTNRKTWRGRIGVKVAEMSSYWKQDNDSRFMPSSLDYLKFRAAGSPLPKTESNQKFLRKANSRFLIKALSLAVLLVVGYFVSASLLKNRESIAIARWEKYLTASPDDAGEVLDELKPLYRWIRNDVNESLEEPASDHFVRNLLIRLQCDTESDPRAFAKLPLCFDRELQHEDSKLLLDYLSGLDDAIPILRQAYSKADGVTERMNIACCLLGLGDKSIGRDIFNERANPDLATRLSHVLLDRIPLEVVLAFAEQASEEPDFLFHLLVALEDLEIESLTAGQRSRCVKLLKEYSESHPDSGVHSMVDLLARRWKLEDDLTSIEPTDSPTDNKDWWKVELRPGIIVTFVRVRSGSFSRGIGHELPSVHRDNYFPSGESVNIAEEFWVSDSEVSLRALKAWCDEKEENAKVWARLTKEGRVGAIPEKISKLDAAYPAFTISQPEAAALVDWLGKDVAASGFQLGMPTNDEWEFACRGGRGGSECLYFWGSNELKNLLTRYANVTESVAEGLDAIQPSAQRIPNRLGAFDMLGNVMEFARYTDREREIRLELYPDNKKEAELEMAFYRGGKVNQPSLCTIPFINANAASSYYTMTGIRLILKSSGE
jgi:serine/threonine protein kinase/formylglycine-generating enzyme required for sulfatase activity